MSDGTDIAEGFSEAWDAVRELLGPSGSLKILSGSTAPYPTVATYDTGWVLPRKEYNDLATGKKFRKLKIADPDGTRKAELIEMTALQIDSVIYKNPAKDPQLYLSGGVPVYEFKLQPTGERV